MTTAAKGRATAWLRGAAIAGLLMAWSLPCWRALHFHDVARGYFADCQSLDAATDLDYAVALLGAYAASLAAVAVFAGLLSWRPRWWMVFPFCAMAWSVFDVVRRAPEAVIVFFPSMHAWQPAVQHWLAVGVALVLLPRGRPVALAPGDPAPASLQ